MKWSNTENGHKFIFKYFVSESWAKSFLGSNWLTYNHGRNFLKFNYSKISTFNYNWFYIHFFFTNLKNDGQSQDQRLKMEDNYIYLLKIILQIHNSKHIFCLRKETDETGKGVIKTNFETISKFILRSSERWDMSCKLHVNWGLIVLARKTAWQKWHLWFYFDSDIQIILLNLYLYMKTSFALSPEIKWNQ